MKSKNIELLESIKNKIETADKYFSENIERYKRMTRFVVKSALDPSDKEKLKKLTRPQMEFNILSSKISRLRGEFSHQQPSFSARALVPQMASGNFSYIEDHLRAIFREAETSEQFSDKVMSQSLLGGYSVAKVEHEYESNLSFNQRLKVTTVFDPTLTGFDPLARNISKSDASYCYEIMLLTEKDFKYQFPSIRINPNMFKQNSFRFSVGFDWFYEGTDNKVIALAIFYEKTPITTKIHKLSSGEVVTDEQYKQRLEEWNDDSSYLIRGMVPPTIVESRTGSSTYITKYYVIGDQIVSYKKFPHHVHLPLAFFDGDSMVVSYTGNNIGTQFTRPYVYNAKGLQQLKNLLGQSFAADIQNMEQHKWLVANKSIPSAAKEEWTAPQYAGVLRFNERDDRGNELPVPQVIHRAPLSPELLQAFNQTDNAIQDVLGSYDPVLGTGSSKYLSGEAFSKGSIQSSLASSPYVNNYFAGLQQLSTILVDLMPVYYKGDDVDQSHLLPFDDRDGKRSFHSIAEKSFDFKPLSLEISVSAGVNSQMEKQKSIETLASISRAFPVFQNFIDQEGLSFILKNLDLRGIEELREKAAEFQKKIDQQRQQQAAAQSQQQAQDIQLKLAEEGLQLEAQKAITDRAYKASEVQLKKEKLDIERDRMENDRLKVITQASSEMDDHQVSIVKSDREHERSTVELLMKQLELANSITKMERQEESQGAKESKESPENDST